MNCLKTIALSLSLFLVGLVGPIQAQLQMNFYANTCPNAEKIVQDFVSNHISNAPSLAAALLRMHFHDCFVRGCDGSVLINSTSGNAERDATPNLTGGPSWSVPTGRRDGRISNASEALANIPPPTSNFTNLQTLFANQGLDLKDLVLLSGAHTIGVSHCSSFTNRLYNFTGRGDQDPALDSQYAANLKSRKCPSLNDNTTIVEMDPGSRKTFDLSYYQLVLKRRGLFQSDSALTTNPTTLSNINQLLKGSVESFFSEFAKSMEKMGRINVKTGSAGVVRRQCSVANS
uniref:Peroxidase n=1 Tax=Brassica campestris TaxID=3711 RepID=M4EUJ2_BRACM